MAEVIGARSSCPGSWSDKIPMKMDEIPMKIHKIPMKMDKIPMKIDKIPMKMDKIPMKIGKIPKNAMTAMFSIGWEVCEAFCRRGASISQNHHQKCRPRSCYYLGFL